ncbi:MAG TPA: hypothetical protein VGK59_19840 [Ohtaekwangia sp.]
MTTFFEHQRSTYKRNYLRNLICLASSDGFLDNEEKELLLKIGLKRGLKEWQINELIEDNDIAKHEVFLPESVSNRMNMLYDLMQIIYADNHVTQREMEFMTNIIQSFQLRPEIVMDLIRLFEAGTPSHDEWKEFVEFVCEDSIRQEQEILPG